MLKRQGFLQAWRRSENDRAQVSPYSEHRLSESCDAVHDASNVTEVDAKAWASVDVVSSDVLNGFCWRRRYKQEVRAASQLRSLKGRRPSEIERDFGAHQVFCDKRGFGQQDVFAEV